jgi:hypothetical protein
VSERREIARSLEKAGEELLRLAERCEQAARAADRPEEMRVLEEKAAELRAGARRQTGRSAHPENLP